MRNLTVADLAGVVYTSGKVFDGLGTGRLDTENFLRSGSLDGITSRSDLQLLQDLRDVAQFIIDHHADPIDANYVRNVNAKITRSGPLNPGLLRRADQRIGVPTSYGRHEPAALTDRDLQGLLDRVVTGADSREAAVNIFVELAKAQPFEDGNKRTALFVANGLLIGRGVPTLLTIPVDDDDPAVAKRFNDLLARAYVLDEPAGVRDLLHETGFVPAPKLSSR